MTKNRQIQLLIAKKIQYALVFIGIASLSIMMGCKDQGQKEAPIETEISVETIEIDAYDQDTTPLVMNEHHVSDVPLTSAASKKKVKPVETTSDAEATEAMAEENMTDEEITETEDLDYEVHSTDTFHSGISELDYEVVEVSEAVIPLGETQTVVGYNKKGKVRDSLQVISEADGTIDKIIFTHKKHRDVYNVQAGMTTKEVKKLRKEIKRMVKKDQLFLYTDTSNIMYLVDIKDLEGDELMEAEIDTLTVEAIIWKDKK